LPTVATQGGPVLTAPKIVPIFFHQDDPMVKLNIGAYCNAIGGSSYWTATVGEYGVGAATSTPVVDLNEIPKTQIDDSEIQTWLAGKLNSNDPLLPAADSNTLYAIY